MPKSSPEAAPLRELRELRDGSGARARVDLQVADTDTAAAWQSGDVPVLSTPRLIALCEEASVRVLGDRLGSHHTSVASRVRFDHLAPVPVGATVRAEATLERVEGRRLHFTVNVITRSADHAGLVGAGRLTRVVVDRCAFLVKAGVPDGGTQP